MKFSFKTATIDKRSQLIILKFPMDNDTILGNVIKIPHIAQAYESWECPANKFNIENLKKWGFELSQSLVDWKEGNYYDNLQVTRIPKNRNGLVLMEYQKVGVSFIDKKNGRCLIADEMGLGKTIETLSWLQLHPEKRPALILCPSFLKVNWERETKKWVDDVKIEILEGRTPTKISSKCNITIINYEILEDWIEEIKRRKFSVLIADEGHFLKNSNAKRTKAFKRINRDIPHLIILTGTPIDNKPVELYNLIYSIDPNVFPNYYSYIHRFCGAKRGFAGHLDSSGASNTEELNSILKSTVMLRRKKIDVLKELPPKLIVKVPLKITNREEYNKAEKEFIEFILIKYKTGSDSELKDELKQFAKNHKIEVTDELSEDEMEMLRETKIEKVSARPTLPQIEVLKQLAVDGKINEIINWIETFLENGEKLAVFAIHEKVVARLMVAFPKAVKVDGSVSKTNRQKAVDEFQNNPNVKLFIGNIKAAGVGITLTAASNVAIIEFPWSPSVVSQAIDRVHRITQTKQVTAWHLVGEKTIEERIMDILKSKENTISKILDGEEFKDTSVLMELIESYKKIGGENYEREK